MLLLLRRLLGLVVPDRALRWGDRYDDEIDDWIDSGAFTVGGPDPLDIRTIRWVYALPGLRVFLPTLSVQRGEIVIDRAPLLAQ